MFVFAYPHAATSCLAEHRTDMEPGFISISMWHMEAIERKPLRELRSGVPKADKEQEQSLPSKTPLSKYCAEVCFMIVCNAFCFDACIMQFCVLQ